MTPMTGNPGLQDFLVLFINFFFTTFTTLATGALRAVPGLVQLGINLVFGALFPPQPG